MPRFTERYYELERSRSALCAGLSDAPESAKSTIVAAIARKDREMAAEVERTQTEAKIRVAEAEGTKLGGEYDRLTQQRDEVESAMTVIRFTLERLRLALNLKGGETIS